EIYTPAEKRQYGYYCLPFLLDGALVARVDLKADRPSGTLIAQSAHAEEGCCTSEVAATLRDELQRLAEWQGLDDVRVEKKGDLGKILGSVT
ncbi:MAG: DNA glycosylase AlkZ-like family protein, partial [Hyphomicrobiaceae bacterium]